MDLKIIKKISKERICSTNANILYEVKIK